VGDAAFEVAGELVDTASWSRSCIAASRPVSPASRRRFRARRSRVRVGAQRLVDRRTAFGPIRRRARAAPRPAGLQVGEDVGRSLLERGDSARQLVACVGSKAFGPARQLGQPRLEAR
jgi:hypothetical protein